VNVLPEKTEPELSPNWPNQPNHLNVSREISKNVNQAQVATNVLDQHLTNTSIPSKKTPTLMTTRMSTVDTETGLNGLNAIKIAVQELKCVNVLVTTHSHKVLVQAVKSLEMKVKPEAAHSNNAQSTDHGVLTETSDHAQNHAEVGAKSVPELALAQPHNTVEKLALDQPQTQTPATPKLVQSTDHGVLTETSDHAQNHAEVEAKSVPELAPAQPHNTVEKIALDQPQTQTRATPKLAQPHGLLHETVASLDVTSRPTTTSNPSKLVEICAIKKHHANLSTGIQLQRLAISTTVI